MFLVDTNLLSELRKAESGRANPGVVAWGSSMSRTRLFMSVVTLYEFEYGVRLAERSDPTKGATLRRWLDEALVPTFEGRVLSVDETVARAAAGLMVPDPFPFRDAIIAGTAAVHRLTLVSGDTVFHRVPGLDLINPWT